MGEPRSHLARAVLVRGSSLLRVSLIPRIPELTGSPDRNRDHDPGALRLADTNPNYDPGELTVPAVRPRAFASPGGAAHPFEHLG